MHAWCATTILLLQVLPPGAPLPFSAKNFNLPALRLTATPQPEKFGALKLCPPGGRSFFEAFELACPMKRKKRSLDEHTHSYRPATLYELMEICCSRGCEFSDLFPYCGPFASW
ncbi:CBN-INS-17 protein [Aphelenchoides avenae]|nr:CBN-INS-17 protein [Aphelenchus avenae]